MKTSEAWQLVGGLSKPSKMPGWSIGIPAAECKTGKKLQLIHDQLFYMHYYKSYLFLSKFILHYPGPVVKLEACGLRLLIPGPVTVATS